MYATMMNVTLQTVAPLDWKSAWKRRFPSLLLKWLKVKAQGRKLEFLENRVMGVLLLELWSLVDNYGVSKSIRYKI